jgi:transcriptional regulator with GAF, ATPase, and Fis domain
MRQFTLAHALEQIERSMICTYLSLYKGNVTHAAKALGVKKTTLFEKMKRFNIHSSMFEYPLVLQADSDNIEMVEEAQDNSEVTSRTRSWRKIKVPDKNNLRYQAIVTSMEVLEKHNWNRTHAARELGLSLRCMRMYCKEAIALGIRCKPNPKGAGAFQDGR